MANEYLSPYQRSKIPGGGGGGPQMKVGGPFHKTKKGFGTTNTATGESYAVPRKPNTAQGGFTVQSKADVLAGENPTSYNQSRALSPFDRNMPAFDTQNFDVNDPEQVANFQKMFMGMKEGDAGWGMMGPKTTKRFQDYVNQSRMDSGMDAYSYGGGMNQTFEDSMNQNVADLLNQDQLLNLTQESTWKPDPTSVQEKVLATDYGDDTSFRDQNVWQNIGDATGQTFEDIGSTVSDYWNSMWGGYK